MPAMSEIDTRKESEALEEVNKILESVDFLTAESINIENHSEFNRTETVYRVHLAGNSLVFHSCQWDWEWVQTAQKNYQEKFELVELNKREVRIKIDLKVKKRIESAKKWMILRAATWYENSTVMNTLRNLAK